MKSKLNQILFFILMPCLVSSPWHYSKMYGKNGYLIFKRFYFLIGPFDILSNKSFIAVVITYL